MMFFRISSDLVPFASHQISDGNWKEELKEVFASTGDFIRRTGMRISTHPDQFNVINSKRPEVVEHTSSELDYHAAVLDLLGLDLSAKIQIHVGGVYGDKKKSMERFAQNYCHLPEAVIRRLVIENDDRSYTFSDCMKLSKETGVPVLFDYFHHSVNSSGDDAAHVMEIVSETWRVPDGVPMTDYSSQMPGARKGSHTESIDTADFRAFLESTKPFNFDVMLEIKDKEASAFKALEILADDSRFEKL